MIRYNLLLPLLETHFSHSNQQSIVIFHMF